MSADETLVRKYLELHRPMICKCGHSNGQHSHPYAIAPRQQGTGWCAAHHCPCEEYDDAGGEWPIIEAFDRLVAAARAGRPA